MEAMASDGDWLTERERKQSLSDSCRVCLGEEQ